MAEMAVSLTLLFPLIFGTIEATRLCMVAQLLTSAARQGCRVAVGNNAMPADVTAAVNAALGGTHINTASSFTSTLTPASIQTTKLGDTITLTLTVNYKDVSWLSPPAYFATMSLSATATLSSERPSS